MTKFRSKIGARAFSHMLATNGAAEVLLVGGRLLAVRFGGLAVWAWYERSQTLGYRYIMTSTAGFDGDPVYLHPSKVIRLM